MNRYERVLSQLGIVVFTSGCLDPLVADNIDPSRVFGDPSVDVMTAPHLEDDPQYEEQTSTFPGEVSYLTGYAEGSKISYWNVSGPATNLIADIYFIMRDGKLLEAPIIDLIPGDAGYSPLWRIVNLSITEAYQGEKIRSRAAIDLAIELGLLEHPEPTKGVVNCPVVRRETRVRFTRGSTTAATPVTGWYRNLRVNWFSFLPALVVPLELKRIPVSPVYIFQRINEAHPIFESASGVDEDGDSELVSSNNVFPANVTDQITGRYSPIGQPWLVRTSSTYPSIDTEGVLKPAFTAESDFYDTARNRVRDAARIGADSDHAYVVDIEKLGGLVNYPIQKKQGEL